jgi:outer membrane protein assembly factor BamB
MWTKPIQDGGVLGGNGTTGEVGNMYYMGMTYNQRFSNPIIMNGRLVYVEPVGNGRAGGDMVAVDLRTGKDLWRTNTTGIGDPSFGYYYAYDDGNQHGILPEGLLFTNNFARAYDPTTGRVTSTNITYTPSGTSAIGPKGEHLRYVITTMAAMRNQNYYLMQWNSSKINEQTYGQIGAQNWYPSSLSVNGTHYFDWNVTLPQVNGVAAPAVVQAIPGDILLGRSTNFIGTSTAVSFGTPNPYTYWAVSLKPGQEGRLLWVRNYTAPGGNVSIIQGPVNPVDPINRVFVTYTKETMSWTGYSLDTGEILWGPKTYSQSGYDYYEGWLLSNIAYGKLYTSNYGGILYAMDTKTGNLVFTYGNGGEGNSTNSGLDTVWGRYPIWIGAIADNKIYLFTSEHSPNTPMYKDAQIRCIDANRVKKSGLH